MQNRDKELKEYEEEKRPFDDALRDILKAKPKPPEKPKKKKKSS